MTVHTIRATSTTCHASFSARHEPALTIDPGDSVTLLEIPDVAWGLEGPTSTTAPRRKMEPRDSSGPCLCGPIAVRGARAGGTLAVRIDEVVPGAWGFTWAGGPEAPSRPLMEALGVAHEPLSLLRWDIDAGAGVATNQHGHRLAIEPFFGCIGLAHAPEHEGTNAWRPRRTGGNMDCRLLGAGTTLLLPIEAEGALLSVGDTHASQGDGEVSGTAIESMCASATLTISLAEPRVPIDGPVAITPSGLVTLGFASMLERAVVGATSALLDLLAPLLGLSPSEALALASVVVRVGVTQLVNGDVGAHALLPAGFLRENGLDPAIHLGLESANPRA